VPEPVLADTSVWVDHLRKGNAELVSFLNAGVVWSHAFVIGELACGNLTRRAAVLGSLAELPRVSPADHHQVLDMVEGNKLMGRGLGWIDMHLLVAAAHSGLKLWSLDKRLAAAAEALHGAGRLGAR